MGEWTTECYERGDGPGRSDATEAACRITDALRGGRPVAMFLDYDGTLREIEPDPAAATPTAPLRALFDELAADRRFAVTIVSGRTPRDLESFLDGYCFGLVAEHGAATRRAESRQWELVDDGVGGAWQEPIGDILRRAVECVPGSFIEPKRTSLVWHYRRSDAEAGERKAVEMLTELSALVAGLPLCVRKGKKIIEVTPSAVTKGGAVGRLVEEWDNRQGLVVVAGDDATDESMYGLAVPDVVSIKVGEGPTAARYGLPAPADLRRLLEQVLATGV